MTFRASIIFVVCIAVITVLAAPPIALGDSSRLIRIPSVPPAFVAADINGDQIVNGSDVAEIFAQWGPCNQVAIESCHADATSDGVVDGADLSHVLALFGQAWSRHDSGNGALYMPVPGAEAHWRDSPFPGMRRLSVTNAAGRPIESVDQERAP